VGGVRFDRDDGADDGYRSARAGTAALELTSGGLMGGGQSRVFCSTAGLSPVALGGGGDLAIGRRGSGARLLGPCGADGRSASCGPVRGLSRGSCLSRTGIGGSQGDGNWRFWAAAPQVRCVGSGWSGGGGRRCAGTPGVAESAGGGGRDAFGIHGRRGRGEGGRRAVEGALVGYAADSWCRGGGDAGRCADIAGEGGSSAGGLPRQEWGNGEGRWGPREEARERVLWRRMGRGLGLERVGVEGTASTGGARSISIQVSCRGPAHGSGLTPAQLFQPPDVVRLWPGGEEASRRPDGGVVSGEVALLTSTRPGSRPPAGAAVAWNLPLHLAVAAHQPLVGDRRPRHRRIMPGITTRLRLRLTNGKVVMRQDMARRLGAGR